MDNTYTSPNLYMTNPTAREVFLTHTLGQCVRSHQISNGNLPSLTDSTINHLLVCITAAKFTGDPGTSEWFLRVSHTADALGIEWDYTDGIFSVVY